MRKWSFRTVALAAVILATGVSPAADNDVLYWMVDDTATVHDPVSGNDKLITAFVDPTTDYAARIRVTGGDITGDTFLSLYNPDGTTEPGVLGVDFSDGTGGSGYWGAGVPTGNQSPSGDYSAGSPEYSFIVEIGDVVWDDQSSSWSWTTVAALTLRMRPDRKTGISDSQASVNASASSTEPSTSLQKTVSAPRPQLHCHDEKNTRQNAGTDRGRPRLSADGACDTV